MAELTRLGQTLMHITNLHWIVADDNEACNPMIVELLKKFGMYLSEGSSICSMFVTKVSFVLGMPFTQISSPMPQFYRKAKIVPRGVANRRAALSWIRSNVKTGVIYFGDDDNTFDLKLFDEIRHTRKVSMFPVGLIGEYGISSPVLKDVRKHLLLPVCCS